MDLYSMLKIGGFSCGLGFSCSLLSTESSKTVFYLCNSCGKLSGPHGKNMGSSLYGHETHRQRIPMASVIRSPACCTPWP